MSVFPGPPQVLQSYMVSARLPTLARPLRIEFPGAVYYVISRGYARQDIVAKMAGSLVGFLEVRFAQHPHDVDSSS